MNREILEISKEQQRKFVDMLEEDKIDLVLTQLPEYIIYDKYTFNRLRKKYQHSNGNIELADLKDRLKVFISGMHELPETAEVNKKGFAKVGEKIMSPVTTVILGLISIAIGIWGELIPPEIYDTIKAALGDYYIHVWTGAGMMLIGTSVYFMVNKKNRKQEYLKKQQELEISQRAKFIEKLLIRYSNRLDQKLDDRISLELDFEEVDEKIKEDNTLFFKRIRTIEEEQEKLAELADKHSFILILGKPGSGKTSRLLDLAKGLLERAQSNHDVAIPTIFNLASWNETHDDLGEWLAKVLVDFYSYPTELAYSAIVENKIIPLLDGFDEVGMHLDTPQERNRLRSKCLNRITNYKNQKFSPKQFVICSRIEEYKQADGDAPVDLKIIVKDVTPEKVIETLKSAKEKSGENYKNANTTTADNLLKLNKEFPGLVKVLQTPFYFNAAMQTFSERADKNLKIPSDEQATRDFIVEKFIERKTSSKDNKYGKAKTSSYLKWLATWLKNQENVSFELAHFQPYDLDKPKAYSLAYGLVYSLVGGLVIGLTFGLTIGLIGIFVIGFSVLFRNGPIRTREIRIWDWSKLANFRVIGKILVYGLALGLAVGLITGLISSFFETLVGGFVFGSVFGFVFGLIGGLVAGLEDFASEIEYFTTIDKPYRRLNGNIKRDVVSMTMTLMFAAFLVAYFYAEISFVESIGHSIQIGVIIGGLSIMSSPMFMHLILSFLLKKEQKAPFRMDQFYDYCSDLRLLEKEGGSWRFRHQIIHDYFIDQAESK